MYSLMRAMQPCHLIGQWMVLLIVKSLWLGYGVVKTLNYINEARNVDSANADLQSQSASSSSLELSPRKRKARGMFTDDDISTAVVVQEQPQKGTHDFSMSNNRLDATDTKVREKISHKWCYEHVFLLYFLDFSILPLLSQSHIILSFCRVFFVGSALSVNNTL